METIQERLNKELKAGKSIAWWARGYYVSHGGPHGFNHKIPIFDLPSFLITSIHMPPPSRRIRVLIEYLGEMMWINVSFGDVFFGNGGELSPSKEGKLLRAQIEALKS